MNDLFVPLTDAELKEIRQRQAEIESATRAIHVYWLARRTPPASQSTTYYVPPKRKVGGHDPCPCGSGEEYTKYFVTY